MKATLKQLTDLQKVLIETVKLPMKWKTALDIEEFLKRADRLAEETIEKMDFNKKKQELVDKMNAELEKRVEEKQKEVGETKTLEEVKKLVLEEMSLTEAKKEEEALHQELLSTEVEVEPFIYKIDETLPAMFNYHMRDYPNALVKFRIRDFKAGEGE